MQITRSDAIFDECLGKLCLPNLAQNSRQVYFRKTIYIRKSKIDSIVNHVKGESGSFAM